MLDEYCSRSYRRDLRPAVDANLIKDNTAIVGIGQTEFSRNAQRDELDMACEAIKNAVADAGLTMADIDGLEALTLDRVSMPTLVGSLGIPNLRFTSEVSFGGGGAGGRNGDGARGGSGTGSLGAAGVPAPESGEPPPPGSGGGAAETSW